VRDRRYKRETKKKRLSRPWVLVQFEDTPKAFAKFSPGLERATTLGHTREKNSTLKALAPATNRIARNSGSLGSVGNRSLNARGLVLVQFEDTPKAFANYSPGLLQPWVQGQDRPNAESVR
jgi:hypothetical protein